MTPAATSSPASSTPGRSRSLISTSCGATVFVTLYMAMAAYNLYHLMYPLARIDVAKEPRSNLIKPLWQPKEAHLQMKVYLSVKPAFQLDFMEAEYNDDNDRSSNSLAPSILLWQADVGQSGSISQSFLLTSLACNDSDSCTGHAADASYQYAKTWLDDAAAADDGGLLSAMAGAGQGIESTSILITAYQSISTAISSILARVDVLKPGNSSVGASSDPNKSDSTIANPVKHVVLNADAPFWHALQSNSTAYVHVLVIQTSASGVLWPPKSYEESQRLIRRASQSNAILVSQGVSMIRHDEPHHISPPKRILYHDLIYLWRKHVKLSREMPPWVMAYYKPEEYASHEMAVQMKAAKQGYPYWKPEVAIKYVNDDQLYPKDLAGMSGFPLVGVGKRPNFHHPTGFAYTPALHVDEIGMTSEKYIPVNTTITSLPLRVSFDRNDLEHTGNKKGRHTATAGGMSPARWRLLTHLSEAIEAQKKLGFEQSDIDDLRRLVADTNITLLAITMLASALHLLFEFLTFKSEISFWRQNKDLTGLSVRALYLDMMGQTIILLFLIEKDSSLLMTVPSGIGCLIALWKCQRATGLRLVTVRAGEITSSNWLNCALRIVTGLELRATRLVVRAKNDDEGKKSSGPDLTAFSLEADRAATRTLGIALLPLVLGYTIYSLINDEYTGWYSWIITSMSSAVYALGFVLMTPQLFLNYKLKSVAHLPWKVLVYKSLNTFIDDLFSFIIRMPTMARISCFRDDVVFFVYLYQRWLYPVDRSRPVEGLGEELPAEPNQTSATRVKKDQ